MQSSVKMLKKRGRKFFPPFEFLVIERFHISQNLHKSILPITGVYLNMNKETLSRLCLTQIFVFFLPRRTKFYDFSFFLHGKGFAFFRRISF